MGEVVLLGAWFSVFAMRTRIALAEKAIHYVYQEEDLHNNKSHLLLMMNPVHKKIPVLIHNSQPVCESLLIVQYIDEVWSDHTPLMPSDPYERAQAGFWAHYADKVYCTGRDIWLTKGGKLEKAKAEYLEGLKVLEEQALDDKTFFGGDEFGFADAVLIPMCCYFYTYEVAGNFKTEVLFPKLVAWANRCKQRESVLKTLPDPQRVHEFILQIKIKLGV